MKAGWETKPLGDVCTLQRGFDLPTQNRKEGTFPLVSSSGVIDAHIEGPVSSPGVVTGRSGSIGNVFYIEEDFWPLNTALYVIDFKGNDPRFTSYFLRNVLKGYQSEKAAIPGVDRNVLHEIKVRLPSLPEQLRITEILSSYDDLIDNNRRRMALLEDSARQLYREWFVRLRFPGHEHTPIVDGVPQGWERKPLGEIGGINQCNIASGFDGEIEYIDIASVTRNSVNDTTTYEFRDAPGRARRIVRHGDIIWSCVRPNRRSHAVIWQPAENLVASTGFVVISPKSLPTSFLYQAVTTDLFVGYLENHAKGAAYPAVVSADFERATILVPPPAFVTAFDEFAEPLLWQIQNLHSQTQNLRQARDLLLPRLMNGELAI